MNPAINERLERAQAALSRYQYQRALSQAEIALAELEEDSEDTGLRGRACQLAGEAAAGLGDYALAEEYIDHALGEFSGTEELRPLLSCQLTLATCRLRQGDLHQARYLADKVRKQADAEQWPELNARSLIQLGNVCWQEGDLSQAIEHLQRAVRACDDAGLELPANQARSSLGIALSMSGRPDEAEQMFTTALGFFQQEGDFTQAVRCLNNLAGIAFARRDWYYARQYLLDCVKLESDAHNRPDLALSWFNLGLVEQRDGNWRLAKKYFNRSLQLAREVGDRVAEAGSLLQLGVAALVSMETSEAANYVRLAQMRMEGSSSSIARSLPWYAALCNLADNQLEIATQLWDARPPWPQSEDAEPLLELLRHVLSAEFRDGAKLTGSALQQASNWLEEIAALVNSVDHT